MSNVLLRDIPTDQHKALKEIAKSRRLSVNDLLLSLVATLTGNPDAEQIILAYVKIDYIGDLDELAGCADCQNPLPIDDRGLYLGIRGSGLSPVIVCGLCAMSHA